LFSNRVHKKEEEANLEREKEEKKLKSKPVTAS
jgi:hypothetical protein